MTINAAANSNENGTGFFASRRDRSTDWKGGPPQQSAVWLQAEVVAFVVAFLCYVNVLPNDFCDDGIPIVQLSAKVNDPGMWLAIWTTDHWSDAKDATPNRDLLYRPVALSSYRLVRQVTGERPFPQLLLNVCLHAMICAWVARLTRHLKGTNATALVAGVVFAVLPIHTEVIANLVGRADLLATVGTLAALLAHRRSMVVTANWGIVWWRVAASLAAFVAMGSKESGIAVVPLVVLFDGLWYRPWRFASRDRPWLTVGSLFRFTYLLIPTAVYLVLRYHALEGELYQQPALTKTVNVLVDAPAWQRQLGVVQLWGMYWAKTVWPKILCINYSINAIRLATSVFDPHVILGVLVTIALVVASGLAWRKGVRSVAYLSAAIVVCYAPTANALALIQVFFAERIWYLPSVWVSILIALAAARIVARLVGCMALAVIVLAMTERCWIRNAEWDGNSKLFAAAYRDHPDAVAVLRLYGETLVIDGEVAKGIELLESAVKIDLGFTHAHRSLGHAYLIAGDYEQALKHLQDANMQVPGHPRTVEALAVARRELSARNEAELDRLRRHTASDPEDLDAEIALVRGLRDVGQVEEALTRLQTGEDRFSLSVEWQAEYAVTLLYLDRRDAAIDRYHQCLQLAPANVDLTVELAMLLLERRQDDDIERAWRLANHAAQLAPREPKVFVCRAELFALQGDLDMAGRLFREAIRVLPPNSELRRILKERARALGQ